MRDAAPQAPPPSSTPGAAYGRYFAAEAARELQRDLDRDVERARQSLWWLAVLTAAMAVPGHWLASSHYGLPLRNLEAMASSTVTSVFGRTGTAGELRAELQRTIAFAWVGPLLSAAHFLWLRRRARHAPRRAFDEGIASFVGLHLAAAIWQPATLMPPSLLAVRIAMLFALVGGRIAAAARERHARMTTA